MNISHIFSALQRQRFLRAERNRVWAELNSMDNRDMADLNISSADFPNMVAEHMRIVSSTL